MLINRMPRYEILSEEAIATPDGGWRRIVSELGIEFLSDEALALFRREGQEVSEQRVRLDPDFLLEQAAKAAGVLFCISSRKAFTDSYSRSRRSLSAWSLGAWRRVRSSAPRAASARRKRWMTRAVPARLPKSPKGESCTQWSLPSSAAESWLGRNSVIAVFRASFAR